MKDLLAVLPDNLTSKVKAMPKFVIDNMEELRLHTGSNAVIVSRGKFYILEGTCQTCEELQDTVNRIMRYSYHAYENDIADGFITLRGGHRVGLCGQVIYDQKGPAGIKHYSSVNIRRSVEHPGIAEKIEKEIIDENLNVRSTLIVSPPGCGKTTMLRDIARMLSYRGLRVSICDERSEIAAMFRGVSSYDLGPYTDVLDSCSKRDGIIMMIRSMAPDVIITDEIGTSGDVEAVRHALHCGAGVITSIHGESLKDLKMSEISPLLEMSAFKKIIFLGKTPVPGTIMEVCNG